jgi:hypothetical protein
LPTNPRRTSRGCSGPPQMCKDPSGPNPRSSKGLAR